MKQKHAPRVLVDTGAFHAICVRDSVIGILNSESFITLLRLYSSVYFFIYYYNIVTFVSLLLGWVLTDLTVNLTSFGV